MRTRRSPFSRVSAAFAALAAFAAALAVVASSTPASAAGPGNIDVDGRGWGHGRGMGQYGALGYAIDHGWTSARILDHFYGGTSAGGIGRPIVKVRLLGYEDSDPKFTSGRGAVEVTIDGLGTRQYPAVQVRRGSNGKWKIWSASSCSSSTWVFRGEDGSGPATVRPVASPSDDPDNNVRVCETGTRHRHYRGYFEVVMSGSGTKQVVNVVSMDSYLFGVVPREVPASWANAGDVVGGVREGVHAVRSQAVAARSYAAAESRYSYADTCDTTACQVYRGRGVTTGGSYADLEHPNTNAAVDATAGVVRMRSGSVARTEFSSSTGGHTAGGVFPAVVDHGDDTASNPNHTWSTDISASSVEAKYGLGTFKGIDSVTRNGVGAGGGRVTSMRIVFSGGTRTLTGNDFRIHFGLKSDWFFFSAGIAAFGNPIGVVDAVSQTPTGVVAKGWTIDPDTPDPINVHVYDNGRVLRGATANTSRPGVGDRYPGHGPNHGYVVDLGHLSAGSHRICVWAIDVGVGSNRRLGCRTITVRTSPFGSFDSVRQTPTGTIASGWTIDPNRAGPIAIHVYDGATVVKAASADRRRPDVGARYPAYGPDHGFRVNLGHLSGGSHRICVWAIDVGPGSNRRLGCRSISVRANPFGHLDAVNGGSDGLSAKGWTIDPNTPGPIDVHVYRDGALVKGATANRPRADVGARYSGYGPDHGFSVPLGPVAPGTHRICVYAIDVGPGANRLLGCKTVTVG